VQGLVVSIRLKLFAQSKFKINSKDEFDTILSKFRDFESGQSSEATLFPDDDDPERRMVYVIVTSTKLDNIIAAYEKSELASKEFYSKLRKENRLHIIDGPRILAILQMLYRKAYVLAATIEIESVENWIKVENVYIGILRGKDISQLYTDHGDAIFFENMTLRAQATPPGRVWCCTNASRVRPSGVRLPSDSRTGPNRQKKAMLTHSCQTTCVIPVV
jgi:hypothetical protein